MQGGDDTGWEMCARDSNVGDCAWRFRHGSGMQGSIDRGVLTDEA